MTHKGQTSSLLHPQALSIRPSGSFPAARSILLLCCSLVSLSLFADNVDPILSLLPKQLEKAEERARQFHLEAVESNNDSLIAQSYYYLGVVNYYFSRPFLSNQYYRRALETSFGQKSAYIQEKCWNNLGVNYALQGDFPNALEAYLNSLKLSEAKGDKVDIAKSWLNIAELYIQQQVNFDEVEQRLKESLSVFAAAGDSTDVAITYQNLGSLYMEKIDYLLAELYTQRSIELYERQENWYGLLRSQSNLGLIFLLTDRQQQAEALFASSLAQARKRDMGHLETILLFNIAKAYELKGDFNLSLRKYEETLRMARKLQQQPYEGMTLFEMIIVAGKMNNHELIEKYRVAYMQWSQRSRALEQNTIMQELRLLYDFDQLHNLLEQQETRLRLRRQQIQWLVFVIILALGALIVILIMYNRNRKLMGYLYRSARPQEEVNKATAAVQQPTDVQELRNRQLFEKIDRAVATERLYLNSELNLAELSRQVGSNETYVSAAINSVMGINFSTYINRYRIRDAKQLLLDPRYESQWNEIYAACGFNSRSSFYRIFKQEVGLSPSEYRSVARETTA